MLRPDQYSALRSRTEGLLGHSLAPYMAKYQIRYVTKPADIQGSEYSWYFAASNSPSSLRIRETLYDCAMLSKVRLLLMGRYEVLHEFV